MHITVVGLPGSGKGYITQHLIHREIVENGARWVDPKRNRFVFKGAVKKGRVVKKPTLPIRLISSIPLKGHLIDTSVIDNVAEMMATKVSGIYYIDEMQDYFPARGFKEFSRESVKWWTQHRHFDAFIISNTQHPEFVDKICQILTDEVHMPQMLTIPFLGWLVPSSVRPPQQANGSAHYRRDARGDRARWWQVLFGVGTLFKVSVWPPSILGGEKDLTPQELERRAGSKKKRTYWVTFDIGFAERYDSGIMPAPTVNT